MRLMACAWSVCSTNYYWVHIYSRLFPVFQSCLFTSYRLTSGVYWSTASGIIIARLSLQWIEFLEFGSVLCANLGERHCFSMSPRSCWWWWGIGTTISKHETVKIVSDSPIVDSVGNKIPKSEDILPQPVSGDPTEGAETGTCNTSSPNTAKFPLKFLWGAPCLSSKEPKLSKTKQKKKKKIG